MNMKYIIPLLILFVILIVSPSNAITITDNNNTISNNDYPAVAISEVIGFNITLDTGATLHTWYVDGTDQSNNATSFSTSFTSRGYKNVTVTVTDGASTDSVTYGVIVKRASASGSDTISLMNNSGYTDFQTSIDDEDLQGFLKSFIQPQLNAVGAVFYLILYGIPLIMIWIRQEKTTIPVVFFVIFGVIMIAFVPSQWVAPAIILTILSIASMIYMNFKER